MSGPAVSPILLLAFLASGCRQPLLELAAEGPAGKERAVIAIDALAARMDDPSRDMKFDTARARIARGALLPSRVFDDTVAWTSAASQTRTLTVRGAHTAGRYRLQASPVVPAPARPAESQHVIRLTRLSEDEYAWDTDVAYALGAIRARDVGTMIRTLFTASEGRTEAEVRGDYRQWLPRTSRVMGQLFRFDSLLTSKLEDGSTLATLHAKVTPEGIEARYPNFAEYMGKYARTARMHWRLADTRGATYFDFQLREGRLRIRVRSRNSHLVPITGTSRPLPDTLVLHGDMTLKVRVFTAGFRDYQAAFILDNDARETAFRIISREEPEWVLPLVGERLLRTPLRRPFQGSGASFGMSVRDSSGGSTILLRQLHLEVEESAILRFITRLSSTAYTDFAGKVEREEHQWMHELLTGLVSDVRDIH